MKKYAVLLLGLVHGMIFAVLGILMMLSAHEDLLFDQLVDSFTSREMSDEQRALAIVDSAHHIMINNFNYVGKNRTRSLMQSLISSADTNMVSPKGHCGSFAMVLGRLLKRADFPVRIAQMDCSNGNRSCHIFVEAEIDGHYVPLDAMYNLHFRTSNGALATSKQVGENWQFYSKQLPSNYPLYFDYGSVRYTNWQKVPFLMPLIKSAAEIFVGDHVNQISLRSYALNVYKFTAFLVFTAYVLTLFAWACVLRRRAKTQE